MPTWNYLAVHAYGTGELITEPAAVKELMEATIDNYETAFRAQWERLPEKYITGLMAGVTGFRIKVTELLAKEKLSQNKTIYEQQNIIASLSADPDTTARITAEYMQQNLNKNP
ncbi:Protease synthase and sporulation protein PAI 2 [compost metagenome]